MSYPFPGMNPWLENPLLWSDVHHSLISAMRDELAAQVEPRYFVGTETHTYIARLPDAPLMIHYPDLVLLDRGGAAVAVAGSAAATVPIEIDLPFREAIEEAYLEIRLVPDGEVVTVIELLSPTNKRPGPDRDSYLRKREAFLDADVHFVEIDMLRLWEPMPYTTTGAPSDYRIFIRRKERLHKAYLYPFAIRHAIPVFPLPLLPDDQEPLVDLGALLHNVYDRARYKLIIDYAKPPIPALSKTDAAWAADHLATTY